MSTPLTRRRFLAIAATLAAGVGIPFAISRRTNQPTHPASLNQEEQPVYLERYCVGFGCGVAFCSALSASRRKYWSTKYWRKFHDWKKSSACIGMTA